MAFKQVEQTHRLNEVSKVESVCQKSPSPLAPSSFDMAQDIFDIDSDMLFFCKQEVEEKLRLRWKACALRSNMRDSHGALSEF